MNRSWVSVLIVMAVLLSSFCLSPIALAQEAAAGDDNIVGEWDIKYSARGRQSTAKLLITRKDDGALAGVWTSGREASEIADVKFEDGKLTFVRRLNIQGRDISMQFEGKVEGSELTGQFDSTRGQTPVSGTRSSATAQGPGERGPGARGRGARGAGTLPLLENYAQNDLSFTDPTSNIEYKISMFLPQNYYSRNDDYAVIFFVPGRGSTAYGGGAAGSL